MYPIVKERKTTNQKKKNEMNANQNDIVILVITSG